MTCYDGARWCQAVTRCPGLVDKPFPVVANESVWDPLDLDLRLAMVHGWSNANPMVQVPP